MQNVFLLGLGGAPKPREVIVREWAKLVFTILVLACAGADPLLAAPARQDEGPSPATRTTNGHDKQGGATSRPTEAIFKALRNAETVPEATLNASALYPLGPQIQQRMMDILREKTCPEAAFQGIVGTFEFQHDRALVPLLLELYGGTNSPRDAYLTDRLRTYDQQQSMLEDVTSSIDARPDAPHTQLLLRIMAEIVDSPAERMEATRFLIRVLDEPRYKKIAPSLYATLTRITYHEFTAPPQWKAWFDQFSKIHTQGFSESALFRSALARRDERFVAEVKAGIDRATNGKQIPGEWLDPARYPDPIIREHAAKRIGEFRESDVELRRAGGRVLVEALADEESPVVVATILRSLGSLGEGKDDLKKEFSPEILKRVDSQDTTIAIGALDAIAQVGTKADCETVERVYARALALGELGAPLREKVVNALHGLTCGYGTIVLALGDPSPDVRTSAARVLGYGKQASSAPALAQALKTETAPRVQRAIASAIREIESWTDEVIDALLDLARKPGEPRDVAVRGLVMAAGSDKVRGERAEAIVTVLGEAIPVLVATPEKRKAIVESFQQSKGPLSARVLAKWLEAETQPDASKEIAVLLSRSGTTDTNLLTATATSLLAANRPTPAIVLFRAAIDSATGAAATTTQRVRGPELRAGLARALLLERLPDGLVEADVILTQELAQNPEDGQLLLLRGAIREAVGRRAEAAEDFQHALRTEGGAMSEADRRDAELRAARALLESGNAASAKAFLDSVPPLNRERDYYVLLGRTEGALQHPSQSIAHLRTAQKLPGKIDLAFVRRHLVEALLQSKLGEDRLEAQQILSALDAEPTTPPDLNLDALRRAIVSDASRRRLVSELDDAAAPPDVQSRSEEIRKHGSACLPWLFHRINEVARNGPAPSAERRVAAIRSLITDPDFVALGPPSAPATREQWIDFCDKAVNYWLTKSK